MHGVSKWVVRPDASGVHHRGVVILSGSRYVPKQTEPARGHSGPVPCLDLNEAAGQHVVLTCSWLPLLDGDDLHHAEHHVRGPTRIRHIADHRVGAWLQVDLVEVDLLP